MDSVFGLFLLFLVMLSIAQVADKISEQNETLKQINITLKDMK